MDAPPQLLPGVCKPAFNLAVGYCPKAVQICRIVVWDKPVTPAIGFDCRVRSITARVCV